MPLAHGSGHWVIDLMPVAPVLVIAGWLVIMAMRERRRRDR